MNSNDVNSIINNLCDKLGTTASKLIPEMAGYQIAKGLMGLVFSSILLIIAVCLVIKMIKMHKADGKEVRIFADYVKQLNGFYEKSDETISGYSAREWERVINAANRCVDFVRYDDDDYWSYIIGITLSGLPGALIFTTALQHVIGWALSPRAMAFLWIFNQLGGGQ